MKRFLNLVFCLSAFLVIATVTSLSNFADKMTGNRLTNLYAAPDSLKKQKEEQQLPKNIRIPSAIGAINFPHQQHVEDFEVECKNCHHEINAAKLNIPHEHYFDDFWIDCKICHHGKGGKRAEAQACSSCHHKSPSTITDETLSATVVIHKNCWQCHEVGTGAEASQNCKVCHSGEKSAIK